MFVSRLAAAISLLLLEASWTHAFTTSPALRLRYKSRSRSTLTLGAVSTDTSSSTTAGSHKSISDALYQTLINTDGQDVERINSLIQTLISSPTTFDPEICISGPLFSTVYSTGAKTPLWERIGVAGKVNIKGQKYTLVNVDQNQGDGLQRGVVLNYAEIFGPGEPDGFVF